MKIKFDRNQEWPFKTVKKRNTQIGRGKIEYNTHLFARWLWTAIKYGYGKDLKDDEVYTMMGTYMNDNNIKFLHEHINDMDWLCYSPKSDNTLKDDEIRIDFFTEKRR